MATDISTIEAVLRDDFAYNNALDGSQLWTVVQQGTGQAIDMSANSALKITTGVTAAAETIIRSRRSFGNPFRVMFLPLANMLIGQRIANQEFELRVCTEDGNEVAGWLFDGTSTTTAKIRSRNGGVTAPADTSVTILDTATGAAGFEVELWPDEVYWHCRAADNSNGRSYSYVRNRQVPDPGQRLFVEIRVRNGATAPVGNTTLQLDAILIQDIEEITAEITSGRGGGAASQAVPVQVLGTATVNTNGANVTSQNVFSATDPISSANGLSSALYTQTGVDTGTTLTIRPTRHRVVVMHMAGVTPGILIFEESADNTSYRETWRSPVPSDGQYHTFDVPHHLRYYRWKFQNGSVAQTAFWLSDMAVRGEGNSKDSDKLLNFPLTANTGQSLGSAVVFTGPALDMGFNHTWDIARLIIKSDQPTAAFQIQQSMDNTNWHSVDAGVTLAAAGSAMATQLLVERYVRVVGTNGATAATAFFATLALRSL